MTNDFPSRITQWSQVEAQNDEGQLTKAEEMMIEAAKAGGWAEVGKGVPPIKTSDVMIRASLLRYLILGGCDGCEVETSGVQVQGAWIEGTIDLAFAKAIGPLTLIDCYIAERPQLLQCKLPTLNLIGSRLPHGLYAQGAHIAGSVLMSGTETGGQLNFSSAVIDGQLNCEGAKLWNGHGDALNGQGAQIRGDVFLLGAETAGEVSFGGASIGGQLVCKGATLRNVDGKALDLQRVIVKEGFYWLDLVEVAGSVDLASANVADLVDDKLSWEKCDVFRLAGFRYDVLHGSTSTKQRIDWLKKGAISEGVFNPQPYEQLAYVLRESGHIPEARDVLVEKEKSQRSATRQQWREERKVRRFNRKLSSKSHDGTV